MQRSAANCPPLSWTGCYKPILKTENWWPQGICSYFRFRIYTYVTGSHSLIVQGKYLSMKYFVQLIVCMNVCMDVSFCLLCMYNMCMYVIHCRNGCTDTHYNCVIFVILKKKKQSLYHISCWQEWNRKTNKTVTLSHQLLTGMEQKNKQKQSHYHISCEHCHFVPSILCM